ncbi:MAG: hypothetical protein O3A96_11680 [Proteobacteria bacterium]|nr:hypothetical protein [Pseudomonadota bacterium]
MSENSARDTINDDELADESLDRTVGGRFATGYPDGSLGCFK